MAIASMLRDYRCRPSSITSPHPRASFERATRQGGRAANELQETMTMRKMQMILCALLASLLGLIMGPAAAGPPAKARPPTPDSSHWMTRAKVTGIIAANQKIVSPNGIDEQQKLHINGIDQWVTIRGRDLRNPVLLLLHGGPASPDMPLAWTFESPWQDYFTVVEWDQRGAGKTYASNTEAQMAPGMSVDGITDDAAKVVSYLRHRFDKKKIFLMGHSWGSVVGVELAQRHPEWFYAYISVGQVVNMVKNEEAGYAFALEEATAQGNAEAVKALQGIAPYPGKNGMTLAHIGVRSQWEMYYGGLAYGRQDFQFAADTWGLSPDYSQSDLRAIDKGSLFSLKHLLKPLSEVDFDHTTRFGCPVIMFIGAHDETTSHSLGEQWFDKIQAPSKRLVIFAESAHMIMLEQPGRFLMHLVDDALPYAQKTGDTAPAEVVRDQ